MNLDPSQREVSSLLFPPFPTALEGGAEVQRGHLCPFNRQSVSMRLENIRLDARGASRFLPR